MTRRPEFAVLAAFANAVLAATALAAAPEPTRHEAVLEAPPAEVWRLWTTAEGLREWLAPLVEIELRLGGEMLTRYRADGTLGDAGTIVNRILAFEPERMLTLQVARPPAGFPLPDVVSSMWTVIDLEPVDGGARTRLRITGLGFGDGERFAQLRGFFERGNAATIEQLAARIRAGKPLALADAPGAARGTAAGSR